MIGRVEDRGEAGKRGHVVGVLPGVNMSINVDVYLRVGHLWRDN